MNTKRNTIPRHNREKIGRSIRTIITFMAILFGASLLTACNGKIFESIVSKKKTNLFGFDFFSFFIISRDTSVKIHSVSRINSTKVRVVFSKEVSGADNIAHYKIVETLSGDCSNNSTFASSTQSPDFNLTCHRRIRHHL